MNNTRGALIAAVLIISVLIAGIVALKDVKDNENGEDDYDGKKNYCASERPEICAQIYQPVCGWFGQKRQCIKYPCAETYSNSCTACSNENVEYWTDGVCPA